MARTRSSSEVERSIRNAVSSFELSAQVSATERLPDSAVNAAGACGGWRQDALPTSV